MGATVFLAEPLGDRERVECEAVQLKGSTAWLHPSEGDQTLVIPAGNLAGIEGDDVDRDVEQIPTQGGQVTEMVTHVS